MVTNNRKADTRPVRRPVRRERLNCHINFQPPAEIAEDYEAVRKLLGETRRGMAELVVRYAIPMVRDGRLVRLGDKLVPAVGGVPVMESAGAEVASGN